MYERQPSVETVARQGLVHTATITRASTVEAWLRLRDERPREGTFLASILSHRARPEETGEVAILSSPERSWDLVAATIAVIW
jgi:hypothetical protein